MVTFAIMTPFNHTLILHPNTNHDTNTLTFSIYLLIGLISKSNWVDLYTTTGRDVTTNQGDCGDCWAFSSVNQVWSITPPFWFILFTHILLIYHNICYIIHWIYLNTSSDDSSEHILFYLIYLTYLSCLRSSRMHFVRVSSPVINLCPYSKWCRVTPLTMVYRQIMRR